MNRNASCIILAAGKGTRMKSEKPKVLCEVLFRPMLDWVAESAVTAGIEKICIVIGCGGEYVKEHVAKTKLYEGKTCFALQQEMLGTGHAVMQTRPFLEQNLDNDVLILCGDAPFIDSKTIEESYTYHHRHKNSATVISAILDDPTNYGRIIRKGGNVQKIVEHKDTDDKTIEINEVNSGAYWFKASDLLQVLDRLTANNNQGEYYLTDAIFLLVEQGKKVGGYSAQSQAIVLGANDRRSLLKLNTIAGEKVMQMHLDNGVEIVSSSGVIIANDAQIGAGTTILPGTIIKSGVRIGKECVIGPNTVLHNCKIGDHSEINASQLDGQKVAANSYIGPFAVLVEEK